MTREEAKGVIESECYVFNPLNLDRSTRINTALDVAVEALEKEPVLDKVKAEIKEKIEQEEFARSVFRHEEKDAVKAEQCTGSIMAYNNVIKLIDKYKAEMESKE